MSGKKINAAILVTVTPEGSHRVEADDRVLLKHTPSGQNLKVRRPPPTPSLGSSASFPKPKRARRGLAFLGEDQIHTLNSGSEEDEDSDDGDSEVLDYKTLRQSSRQFRDDLIQECEGEGVEEPNVRVENVRESMIRQNVEVEDVVQSMEGQSVEVGDESENIEEQSVGDEEVRYEVIVKEDMEEQKVEVEDVVESMEGQSVEVGDESENIEEQSAGDEDVRYEIIAKEDMEEHNVEVEDVVESIEGEGLEQPAVSQEYASLTDFSWTDDYSTFTPQEEVYLRTPGTSFASQDPSEIFMKIWDESIMSVIVRETNKYAWETIAASSEMEGGVPGWLISWNDTTIEEMYRYFAVLILMSICLNARVKDYWTTGVMGMSEFRLIMSRNRFDMLSRFIHFVDNFGITSGLSIYQKKIAKIRPILDHCNKKFAELYTPMKHLSLDESLLLWKGRHSWVQFIKSKAARLGLKTFELCEAKTGYLLRCLLYAGKNSTMIEEPTHGFENSTAKVVLELMDGYLDVGHCLVMDNWYNQLSLTRYLKRRRTDVIGTMNPRRVHVPPEIKYAASTAIQRKNPSTKLYTHRDFRHQLAKRLLERFGDARVPPIQPVHAITLQHKDAKRLSPGNHFPRHTEKVHNKYIWRRCVRCTAAGRRSMVNILCTFCDVALCVGDCWVEYHTLRNLR